MEPADDVVVLDFADERSVVQTRFATTALALLRAHLGEDTRAVVADARAAAITEPLPRVCRRRAVHLPRPRLDRRPRPGGRR